MNDNLEIIKCPLCEKEMKKVFFPQQGINLDVCVDGCGGIYFDNREFDKFDEKDEDISPLEEVFAGKTFEKVERKDEQLTCPVCGAKMVKNYSSAKAEIEVDDCYSCGGKFLDNTELEKIRNEYENEETRVYDVMEKLYTTAGLQFQMEKSAYAHSQMRPSILTRLIKLKYGKN